MVLVAVAVLIGAALQSATGFGFALVVSPPLFAVVGPNAALTILIVLSIALSLLVLFGERRIHQVRRPETAALMAFSAPGVVLGVMVLRLLDKPALQVGVGLAVVVGVLVDAAGSSPKSAEARIEQSWPPAPTGLVTGTLTTTVGVNGPPLLVFFGRLGATPEETRDSLAACFVVQSVLGAAALLAFGRLELGPVSAPLMLVLLALVAVGRPLGRWLFVRLHPDRFRTAGVALAVIAGLASIAAGVTG